MRELLTSKQVARAIQVSESSVKRWCDKGVIQTQYTAGGHRRIPLHALLSFVKSSKYQLESPELVGLPATSGRTRRVVHRATEEMTRSLLAGNELRCRQVAIDMAPALLPARSSASSACEPLSIEQRIAALRSVELEFVAHAQFEPESESWETNSDLIDAVEVRPAAPPKDLPAHLARLCEIDLLTAEEERKLFRSFNYLKFRAAALRDQLDCDNVDMDILQETERLVVAVHAIRDQLLKANMRLAISVVKKFVTPQRSFDDMLSDGIFSLMQAVEKFDFDRGFRFSTYAYRSIARNAYRKILDGQKEAVRLVNSDDEIFDVEDVGGGSSMDERTWELLQGALSTLMGRLDRRERFIIRSRYALGSHRKVKTFQSVADKLGLSKERVRQLEQRAVAKLRSWSSDLQVLQ